METEEANQRDRMPVTRGDDDLTVNTNQLFSADPPVRASATIAAVAQSNTHAESPLTYQSTAPAPQLHPLDMQPCTRASSMYDEGARWGPRLLLGYV